MKISKYLVGFINVFFVILFSIIFKISINIKSTNAIYLLIFTISIFFIYHIIKKIPDKFYDTILAMLFVTIVLVQFTYIFLYASIPSFDLGEIYNIIDESIINGENICEYEYFNRFTNNGLLGLTLKIIFSVMNFFNNSNYYIGGIIFNVIIIDLSIFLMYKFVKKTFGKGSGILVVFLGLLTIPLHMYASYFYTDTISMIFPLSILLIYLRYLDNNCDRRKKYLYILLIGVISGIGFMFKSTVLLTVISIILYDTFIRNPKNIKYTSVMVIIIAITVLLVYQLLYLTNIIDRKKVEEKSFPYSYWLLIGLNSQGSFDSYEDYNEVKKISGIDRKKEYISDKIVYKIKYGTEKKILHKIIEYNIKKTWGDPTYFVYTKLSGESINNDEKLDIYINSGIKKNIDEFMKINHFLMLILVIISGFKFKNKDDIITIPKITIIGLALFLMVFESRSRYLVNYIPFLLILEIYSIDNIYNILITVKKNIFNKNEINH